MERFFPSVLSNLPHKHKLLLASLLDATESLNLATDVLSTFLAIGWRTQVRMGRGASMPVPTPPSRARTTPVHRKSTIADFATCTLYTHASYAPSPGAAMQQLGLPPGSLLQSNWESSADAPSAAYLLTIDHVAYTIMCTVRGSWSAEDALISSMVAPAPFLGGLAHHGMLACARTLVAECGPTIRIAASRFPQYRVLFTGHSMGAGVATLAALILRNEALFLKEHGAHGHGPALVQDSFAPLRGYDTAHCPSVLKGPLPGTCGGAATAAAPRGDCQGKGGGHNETGTPEAALRAEDTTVSALEHLEVFAVAPGPCVSLDLARACEGWVHSIVHGDDVTPRFNIAGMIYLKQELSNMQWAEELSELWEHRARNKSPTERQAAAAGGAVLRAAWGVVKGAMGPLLRWSGRAREAVLGPSPRDVFWRELEGPLDMHSHPLARMQYYLPGCLYHLQYKYEHIPCSWDGSAPDHEFPLQYEDGVSIHDPYLGLEATALDTAPSAPQSLAREMQGASTASTCAAQGAEAAEELTARAAEADGDEVGGEAPPAHPTPQDVGGLHPQLGQLQRVRLQNVLPHCSFESPCDGGGGLMTPPQVRHLTPPELAAGAAAHHEYFCRVQWSGRMFMDHSTALMYKHLVHLLWNGEQGGSTEASRV